MESILSIRQSTRSTVSISYYEIYMDRCYDLLELKNKEVAILDDKDGKVHLKGLAEVEVSSMKGFYEVFCVATQRRKVAHTNVNDLSSRSHCALVISVSTPGHENSGDLITGKLNLIDLAGNEDNKKTCNEGIRLQESAKINQSLFALSNVIHALNNSQLRIPYRESKLTRVLQDSLGGTSRALMISCLNPGEYQESVHTVSLAARSRHISNSLTSARKETPKVKVDMEAKLRAWLDSRGKTKSAQKPKVYASPLTSKTPNSLIKRVDVHPSSSKAKLFSNQGASNLKQRTPDVTFRSLISSGHRFVSATEALNLADARRNTEKNLEVSEDRGQGLDDSKSDDQVARDEKIANVESVNPIRPPPPFMKGNAFQSPPRKALSPIHTNISIESISANKRNVSLTDLKNNVDSTLQVLRTPLEKINAQSSNLKSFFAEEYIEFLNTASREELLEIRGIGNKLADYILELREGSPLKTLNDLEKLGLSLKQVKNLFGNAAKVLLFE
ncbi:unnamed protein product [Cuscuta campestris]|uniref:Kinesin-like protein n=1 Tax=Cuscuta campestris TaxID=132261 RepID=A0A484NB39_9ASTE|nr:unnamed protein product [Cuscuta campestris]